jgi:6-phosphogluconolactonase
MIEAAGQIRVYASSAGTKEILQFGLDPSTGSLHPVGATPVPGPAGPSPTSMPMALRPDRKRLYVAVRTQPYPVTSFALDDRTGSPSVLATTTLPAAMAYLSTDRSGRYLFAASYVGAMLSLSTIDEKGRVGGPAIQRLATPPKAHSILVDPTNRWVFAAILGGDQVLQLRFDAARGEIEPGSPPMPARRGCGPRHLAFHPKRSWLYAVNELDATVTAYAVDGELGRLQELQSLPMLTPGASATPSAADIHLTPDGRFLYVSERTTHSLVAFAVDPRSGLLERLGAHATEPSPRGFAISPCARFLLAAGQESGQVALHAIDPTDGRLTLIARHPAGVNPNWIELVAAPLDPAPATGH